LSHCTSELTHATFHASACFQLKNILVEIAVSKQELPMEEPLAAVYRGLGVTRWQHSERGTTCSSETETQNL
jgi:hypothetical protein